MTFTSHISEGPPVGKTLGSIVLAVFACYSMKTESWYDAKLSSLDPQVECCYDNLLCYQWQQSWHHDDNGFQCSNTEPSLYFHSHIRTFVPEAGISGRDK